MFDETLFHVMRAVLQEHTAAWSARMPDLTKPQYAVLEAVNTCEEIDQVALGQASATTKATLTEMLVRMESRGLIERRADLSDSRRRLIRLTRQGKEVLTLARPIANDVAAKMLQPLSSKEQDDLVRALAKIRKGCQSGS